MTVFKKYRDGVVITCGGDGTVHSIGNLMIDTALNFAILPLVLGMTYMRAYTASVLLKTRLTIFLRVKRAKRMPFIFLN
ncbi:diacylglycerol kinase family protein [Aerococcus viridans]|uniref:diacylglycerol kinase family protein n=1 Tax=Aerococcus viridans TaxID=1377 RepID=UPI0021B028F6|nr:diacylglycerol kinase family protein [Aerococcus viridans]MCT1797617.1 hypothetical protein [Aerococcus viridans]